MMDVKTFADFLESLYLDAGSLIMLVGPPGSGKTTIASELESRGGYTVISPDEIRVEITGDASNQSKNEQVFVKVHQRIAEAINNGEIVVYDATNCRPIYRSKILRRTKHITANCICVVCTASLQECLANNANRNRTVPDNVIERMYLSLRNNPPTIFEGFDLIVEYK